MKIFFKSYTIVTVIMIIFIALTAISGAISMLTANTTSEVGSDSAVTLTGSWEYRLGDSPMDQSSTPVWAYDTAENSAWKSYSFPGKPPKMNGSDTVWIRTILPEFDLQEPHLFFRTLDSFFELYIDGKLFFKHGQIGDRTKMPGSPWQIIPLPADCRGKWMTFRMYSINHANLGIVSRPAIDSSQNLIIRLVKRDLGTVILSFLYVFTGCATMCIFARSKVRKLPFFVLGLSSVFMGIWLFAETQINLLLLNSSSFWPYIGFISGYLMPAGFCLFIKEIFDNKLKHVLGFLWKAHVLFLLSTLILDALHIVPIILTITPYIFLLVFTMTIVVSSMIISAYKGHPHAKILLTGLIMLVITGVYEIFGWHLKILPWTYHASKWGMLFFLFAIVLIIGRLYTEFQKKLLEFSEEIEYKKKLLAAAEEYDNLKNEFFSNISHEFRTPINIIITSLHLIELYEEKNSIPPHPPHNSAKISKNVKIIRQNCFRLMRLVNNLIDITRIDSGYMEPNFVKSDIVETIKDITMSITDFVNSKGLQLKFSSSIDHMIINFDPDMIERIILNLLSNAVKFTEPDGVISVSIRREEDRVLISIKDTGIGIPEEKLQVIFERFRQAHHMPNKNHEGSGIGLSLVRSLVRMHQGDIFVKSKIGNGSEFTISLPAISAPGHHVSSDYMKAVHQSHEEKIKIELSDISS